MLYPTFIGQLYVVFLTIVYQKLISTFFVYIRFLNNQQKQILM